MNKILPNARECAELLLDTVPALMRSLWSSAHAKRCGEGEELPKNQAMGQYRLLGILHHKERTMSELAALHQVTPSTMSRSVDVLVRRAWVDRDSDPNDRRQVILRLTDQGKAAHQAMIDYMHDGVTQLIGQLDQDDIERLYGGLEVLHKLAAQAHSMHESHLQEKDNV